MRTNLSKGLGFSKEDRDTNILRIGFVAHLLTRNGVAVITAAISPYRDIRDQNRALIGDFVEVYAKCTIEELTRRDVKGLYEKALEGEIQNFTGISDPYEEPLNPEVVVDTEKETVEESLAKILAYLESAGYIEPQPPRPSGTHATEPTSTQPCPPPGVERTRPMHTEGDTAMTDGLIAPHGGKLVNRIVEGAEAQALAEQGEVAAEAARSASRPLSDLEMIAVGGFSPLDRLHEQGRLQVRASRTCTCRAALPWSLPVTSRRSKRRARKGFEGKQIALTDEDGTPLAVMDVAEAFDYDKQDEARIVYRTDEDKHPGVAAVYAQDEMLLGGPSRVFKRQQHTEFLRAPPRPQGDARRLRGARLEDASSASRRATPCTAPTSTSRSAPWRPSTACCCTRWSATPRTTTSRPTCAWTATRRCSRTTTPTNRVLLSVLPGGDALRRPARGDLPRPRAQELRLLALHRRPRPRRRRQLLRHLRRAADLRRVRRPASSASRRCSSSNSFFCRACGCMGTGKTCPHDADDHVSLSGTQVREMLTAGEDAAARVQPARGRADPHRRRPRRALTGLADAAMPDRARLRCRGNAYFAGRRCARCIAARGVSRSRIALRAASASSARSGCSSSRCS